MDGLPVRPVARPERPRVLIDPAAHNEYYNAYVGPESRSWKQEARPALALPPEGIDRKARGWQLYV